MLPVLPDTFFDLTMVLRTNLEESLVHIFLCIATCVYLILWCTIIRSFSEWLRTGLDPAGLFYRGRKAVDERLDKDDANFVDVIHTNMGQLGLQEIIGHASKYTTIYI